MFEDMDLVQLFATADAIGDKYLSPEEIVKRSSDLAAELAEIDALSNLGTEIARECKQKAAYFRSKKL